MYLVVNVFLKAEQNTIGSRIVANNNIGFILLVVHNQIVPKFALESAPSP